jgi:hypothetical protein
MSTYVCVHIFSICVSIYTYIHTYLLTYIHTYIYAHVPYTCTHVSTNTHACAYLHLNTFAEAIHAKEQTRLTLEKETEELRLREEHARTQKEDVERRLDEIKENSEADKLKFKKEMEELGVKMESELKKMRYICTSTLYIHACIHVCFYKRMRAHIYIQVYVCMNVYRREVRKLLRKPQHVLIYTQVMCTYDIYACTYVHMICMIYVYIYI